MESSSVTLLCLVALFICGNALPEPTTQKQILDLAAILGLGGPVPSNPKTGSDHELILDGEHFDMVPYRHPLCE